MSFEFFQPGVYYFSDHNFNEAAEYIGTIIVKPKQVEHFIEISTEGFSPGKNIIPAFKQLMPLLRSLLSLRYNYFYEYTLGIN